MIDNLATLEALLAKASELDSLTLRDICHDVKTNNGNKGQIGQLVEVYHYGKKLDSKSEADLKLQDGTNVELKVVPIKKLKNGNYSAKERLILKKINYINLVDSTFEDTFEKIKIMLIHFYLYNKEQDKMDYLFINHKIYHFLEEDRKVIEKDFNIIKTKVINGEAHTLSDSDTTILAATTKGRGKGLDFIDQPFSPIKAKHRAFTLKTSYISYIFNRENYITLNIETNPFVYLENKLNPFIGKTVLEMEQNFEIISKSKQRNALIINHILGIKSNSLNTITEFAKLDYHFHTINLEENGSLKESLSLSVIKFREINQQDWEDSEIYNILSSRTFIFIVFRKQNNTSILEGTFKYKFTNDDLNIYKELWDKTQLILQEGVLFTKTSRGTQNNLPGIKENKIGHIRCKSSIGYNPNNKKSPFDILPNGKKITKQAFWINSKFIIEIFENFTSSSNCNSKK